MLQWQYFPKNYTIPKHLHEIITQSFKINIDSIDSTFNKLSSNDVLKILCSSLEKLGFSIETGKTNDCKIIIPVLYGKNGKPEKYFEADGYNEITKTVIEVEAGRGVSNYQFLKDLFQASMMVDTEFLVIAVRNIYRNSKDFDKVITFIDTMYTSDRLILPLRGILIIGY